MFARFIVDTMWYVFLLFCLNALIDFCFGVDIAGGIIKKVSSLLGGKPKKKGKDDEAA